MVSGAAGGRTRRPPSRAAGGSGFRGNFRLPYPFFQQLTALVRERDYFPTAERDAMGRSCIPVELKGTTLMAPSRYPVDHNDVISSQWLESGHKDVGCCFGISEGRFRIMKVPNGCQKKDDIDNVFFTCCILHNMLHTFDGMGAIDVDLTWESSGDSGESKTGDLSLDLSSVGAKDYQA